MRPFNTSRGHRRGTVTIIVISFLLIFLILALTFAFYSIAEADQAKVYRDGGNVGQAGVYDSGPAPDPEPLFNELMGGILYGPPDDLSGAFNVLRGHDLARLVYGWSPSDTRYLTDPNYFNNSGYQANQPYNG